MNNARYRHVGVITLASTALLAGGQGAKAATEFPPNPSVEISMLCEPVLIGDLHVSYRNDGGQSDAEFTTVIDGVPQPHISLDAAIWSEKHYPLAEGSPGVVTISAPGMNAVNVTVGPVTCFDATMRTEVTCVNETPTISVTATNTGQLDDAYTLTLQNVPSFDATALIAVGASHTWTQTLLDGAQDVATLSSGGTGLIDSQVADPIVCALPATTIETTVPPTISPSTVPQSVTPATTDSPTEPTSSLAGIPSGSPRLPETGSSIPIILLTAAALTLTGWLLRRSAST